MHVEPGRDEDAGPKVPEEHAWDLEPVEEEPKLQEVREGPVRLVLVHHDDWIDGVAVVE